MQKYSKTEENPARERENIAKSAYLGKPPPADPLERAQYHMMKRLYELHRRGKLPVEDGSYLKKLVLGFDELDNPARLKLLDTFIESWSSEDLQRYESEIKSVSRLYLEVL